MTHPTPIARQLILSRAQWQALRAAAEHAFPLECCGLLLGRGDEVVVVTAIHATANVAEDPRHRFAIDPQVQFDLLRAVRGSSERVVGHYHSHPNGARALSRHDLEMAHDPDAIWLLIPAASGGRADDPVAFVCPTPENPCAVEVRIA